MDWNLIIVDLGQSVVPWAITLLVGLLSKYVYSKIGNDYWKGVAERATTEIFDAAQEVHQTYVKQIKKGREDGNLTPTEKELAKKLALEQAKSNLGTKGFARLAKAMGGESAAEGWMKTKIESSVSAIKTTEKALTSGAAKAVAEVNPK